MYPACRKRVELPIIESILKYLIDSLLARLSWRYFYE